MNSLGLSIIFKMGCLCSKESVIVNSKKYYLRDQLGEGGFSTVYLGEEAGSKRLVAIKKIICHGMDDEKTALREAEYHDVLQHKNILRCLDSSLTGHADPVLNSTSMVLLVLPYYPRGTLLHELERRAASQSYLDPIDILSMFLQICEGIKVFHEAKPEPLAHRDLKTANILLANNNNPIIMDLGSVARARVKITGSSEAQKLQDLAAERCSMPYRAPELWNVESYCVIDERTDIWSLGCLLYAMCYFKSPFDAVYERGDSVALAVISGTINFPESSPFPEDIHDLILFMLRVNPMERPYIYSVIEKVTDEIAKYEAKA
ncbi:Serine/threonine-protein kinase 16 [Frankliniella fusca]|uniref:non-specific serine/threonine protein kinase n=1 Tax=Frankliniella fusca TaxID=407009 RepID=A0AAE1LV69_9NEOP|nr:Serine/threonine-protein kinase 16 [Frankliniella fusca]